MSGKRIVCIAVGQRFVRAVELRNSARTVSILNATEFTTPPDSVQDGFISDTETLGRSIRSELDKAGFKSKDTVFSLISNKVISREAELPYMNRSRLKNAIAEQADEYFPMDLSEHLTSYSIMSRDKAAGKISFTIYAVPADIISSYYELAAAAGLRVESVDYNGNSVYQWMRQRLGGESVMMLQIGRYNTTATIMTDSALRMQRKINYGISDMVEAVVESDPRRDQESAFELLQHSQLVLPALSATAAENAAGETPAGGIPAAASGDMSKLVTESTRPLITNVVRFIEYFLTKNKDEYIDRIMISDEGEMIKGLARLIENETGIQQFTISGVAGGPRVKGGNRFQQFNRSSFIGVTGSAVAPLDFVPADIAARRAQRHERKRIIYMVSGATGLCVLLILLSTGRYAMARALNSQLQNEADGLSYIEETYTAYTAALTKNNEVTALDSATNAQNELLSRLYSDLESQLPSTSVITSMSSSDNMLTLSFEVDSKPTAAELILQLRKIPYLSDIYVSGLTDKSDDTTAVRKVSFTVTCYLSGDVSNDTAQTDTGSQTDEMTGSAPQTDGTTGTTDAAGTAAPNTAGGTSPAATAQSSSGTNTAAAATKSSGTSGSTTAARSSSSATVSKASASAAKTTASAGGSAAKKSSTSTAKAAGNTAGRSSTGTVKAASTAKTGTGTTSTQKGAQ